MRTDDDLRAALRDVVEDWRDDGAIRSRMLQRAAERRRRRAAVTAVAAAAVVGAVLVPTLSADTDDDRSVVADDGTTGTMDERRPEDTTTTTVAPSPVPDLERAAPGREVTFERIGDVRLGDILDPSDVSTLEEGDDCGYWGPPEPSHDGDEPLRGEVTGASTASPMISRIKVYENPRYRTASGVGIGTTLDSLRRVYGDRLVVDRADESNQPTGGLLGVYGDVAAVRDGDAALTYYLRDDRVDAIKLSKAADWGDDEGCA